MSFFRDGAREVAGISNNWKIPLDPTSWKGECNPTLEAGIENGGAVFAAHPGALVGPGQVALTWLLINRLRCASQARRHPTGNTISAWELGHFQMQSEVVPVVIFLRGAPRRSGLELRGDWHTFLRFTYLSRRLGELPYEDSIQPVFHLQLGYTRKFGFIVCHQD